MKKLTTIRIISVLAVLILTACSQQGWTLTSGTPPYADPDPLIYEGNVQLTGWVVYQPVYVGEEVAHFHVANAEALPKNIKQINYQIQAPESVKNEILKSTEENPITIHATKIRVNMEGSPVLTIK